MNNKFDFYFLRLARENFFYVFILFIILLIDFFFIPYQINNYFLYKQKSSQLQDEIDMLANKNKIINSIKTYKIDTLIHVLNSLIPIEEDYFSIFSTLNNLINKTQFTISSYSIKFSEKPRDKIIIQIKGQGSSESFFKFINNYQHGGGRLITIDKLEFSSNNYSASFSLNFYTKDIKNIKSLNKLVINDKTIEVIDKINQEINIDTDNVSSEAKLKEIDYPTKQNPFDL